MHVYIHTYTSPFAGPVPITAVPAAAAAADFETGVIRHTSNYGDGMEDVGENYGSGITETTAGVASETAGVLGMRSSVYDDDTIGIV